MQTVNEKRESSFRVAALATLKVLLVTFPVTLSGCAVFEQHNGRITDSDKALDQSYLTRIEDSPTDASAVPAETQTGEAKSGFMQLRNLPPGTSSTLVEKQELDKFSTAKSLTVNVNEMPVVDFLHYVMGDLLGINYVLDEQV